jgi:hypothetical protein
MLLSAILLVTPTIIRLINNNAFVINSESYNNIRVYNQGNINYDALQGRSIQLNILNLIPLNSTGQMIMFRILPILLGIITVLLAYLVLKKQNVSEKTIIAILGLMIVSPIYSYIFTDYKIYSVIIVLNILGLYFLLDNKTLYSSILFSIIPFIDIFSGIITLVFMIIYMFSSQKHHASYRITSIAVLSGIILSIVINTYYGYNIWRIFQFTAQNIITDIGADIGLSFSILILAVIGLVILWENGWKNLLTYALLILITALAFFNTTIRVYINFILVVYAGFAFIYLNRRKWSITIIKKTTILLIICSILFSTLVYTTRMVRSEPLPTYVDALEFVKKQSLPTENIIGYPKYGYIIEYYADRRVLVDDTTYQHDKSRVEAFENITSSRNLERTESLLQKYNIKYLIIDKDFNSYLKEREGLLFLIENSRKFDRIYYNSDVEVWMYNS